MEKSIKINLGCGSKFVDGYINVDVVKPQGDIPTNQLFMEDDVRELNNFQPNSVDEIVSFHLVEHIPVYDVEPTLIRWHEVLKPGGHIIVELPDIVKSCVNLLQMITTKDSTLLYNNGLLGIYGTPDPSNVWMEHKWGWTFETLCQQFRNAGFVNIREEIPVTHMGPRRDFRLHAEKAITNE